MFVNMKSQIMSQKKKNNKIIGRSKKPNNKKSKDTKANKYPFNFNY